MFVYVAMDVLMLCLFMLQWMYYCSGLVNYMRLYSRPVLFTCGGIVKETPVEFFVQEIVAYGFKG